MTTPGPLDDDHRRAVREFLEAMRQDLRPLPADKGYVYRGKEDFVRRHGRFFTAQDLPRGYRRRKAGVRFSNAFKALTDSKNSLRYVEGFALPPLGGSVAAHHAWCIDAVDRVIDMTWPQPALAYLGVIFPRELVVGGQLPHGATAC